MDIYFLEKKRIELLARCINDDIAVSKDMDFINAFNSFWQSLMLDMLEGEEAFFANFIVELKRELNYDIPEPLCTMPQYNYFRLLINPLALLQCSLKEIAALIKQEVYHIISFHHYRAVKLLKDYSRLAVNLAMDISVNEYIINLPNWANTLEKVSLSYNIDIAENGTMEMYAMQIQEAINKKKVNKTIGEEIEKDSISTDDANRNMLEDNHHSWMDKDIMLEEEQLKEIVDKLLQNIHAVNRPESVNKAIETSGAKAKLSWQKLLLQSFGSTAWKKKKTITRRDRRMPDRLDLRGKVTHYISEVIVAIDVSGSMTEREIDDILTEIKGIVKSYNATVTVIECDNQIRAVYSLNSAQHIKKRPKTSGSTKFTPVYEYISKRNLKDAILIYFTDGLGEESLEFSIVHYKTIWVITSSVEKLSLKNPPGIVINLGSVKENKEEILPLEFLKSEMQELRSEWAK